ncbi:MAG: pyruvate kinase [bacterium]
MSRTKIVATYGPACEDEKVFKAMIEKGLDVVRLNVSHLEPSELLSTTTRLRNIAAEADMPLAVLADMPGPKIRCSQCEPKEFELDDGEEIELAAGDETSTPERLHVQYPYLFEDVEVGHELAINDGLVLIRIEEKVEDGGYLRGKVLRGGPVSSRKGVSFLQSTLRIAGLTDRDRLGLKAAVEAEVDFVALSFVRSAEDIQAAREIMKEAGDATIPIVAKIEQHEAIDNIEDILEATDGIMVARGDMGIEQPLEHVPLLQKDIIRRSNETGRFVITATQMLESMIEHARPTRAEVTDVANAILDGSDAVMLSAETAMGANPPLVVDTMTRIAISAETRIDAEERLMWLHHAIDGDTDLDDALALAACQLALNADIDAFVCLSFYGSTARRISRYRPDCPIYVLSPYVAQCRRLAITWGVEVFAFPEAKPEGQKELPSPSQLIDPAIRTLRDKGRLQNDKRIVMLAGIPLDAPGGTNWMRVVEL